MWRTSRRRPALRAPARGGAPCGVGAAAAAQHGQAAARGGRRAQPDGECDVQGHLPRSGARAGQASCSGCPAVPAGAPARGGDAGCATAHGDGGRRRLGVPRTGTGAPAQVGTAAACVVRAAGLRAAGRCTPGRCAAGRSPPLPRAAARPIFVGRSAMSMPYCFIIYTFKTPRGAHPANWAAICDLAWLSARRPFNPPLRHHITSLLRICLFQSI